MYFAANAIDAALNQKESRGKGIWNLKFRRLDLRGVRQGVGNQERE